MVFSCPFPDTVRRHIWDTGTRLNLDGYDGVEFIYSTDAPAAFSGITIYLRSGGGWFAASLPVGDGTIRHWVARADFTQQEHPEGWDKISGLRISPWSAARGSGAIRLHAITPRQAAVALARPGEQSSPQPQERNFGIQAADWLGHQFDRMGVPYAMLSDADITDSDIPERYRALILPYHPNISAPALRRLQNFAGGGGKLYIAYNANRELAELMGVQTGTFLPGQAHEYHAMGFVPKPEWRGPMQVFQGIPPNLLTIKPAGRDTKVLAWWLDDRGRRQDQAACLQSPRGAWFSHILSTDDDAAQRRMLAALLDESVPGLFADAARHLLHDIDTELKSMTPAADTGAAHDELRQLQTRARELLDGQRPDEAWDAAELLQKAIARHALAEIDNSGMQGIWVGTEMLTGNLGTMADGLARAGFSDIFLQATREAESPGAFTAIAAQHRINIHLWYICWNLDGMPADELDRLQTAGRLQQSAEGGTTHWLCPTQRANQMLELQRLMKLASQPEIAGIHLDYIRYPDAQHCFCPSCRKAFEEETDQRIEAWPATVLTGPSSERFLEWRAQQITDFVAEFSRQARLHHPNLKLSAAVFPLYPACRLEQGQDWGRWLADSLLDFVCPMNYTSNTGEFSAWFRAQTELPGARGRVIPGIGAASDHSRLSPSAIVKQILAANNIDNTGFVIYKLTHGLNRVLLPAMHNARRHQIADDD
ncbi:MAG: family 10 glycosylhydrolase [Lentisphaerae bacterium]|nr:family 10 glycosylhydrolase [Lentisphaerota bacterium]